MLDRVGIPFSELASGTEEIWGWFNTTYHQNWLDEHPNKEASFIFLGCSRGVQGFDPGPCFLSFEVAMKAEHGRSFVCIVGEVCSNYYC